MIDLFDLEYVLKNYYEVSDCLFLLYRNKRKLPTKGVIDYTFIIPQSFSSTETYIFQYFELNCFFYYKDLWWYYNSNYSIRSKKKKEEIDIRKLCCHCEEKNCFVYFPLIQKQLQNKYDFCFSKEINCLNSNFFDNLVARDFSNSVSYYISRFNEKELTIQKIYKTIKSLRNLPNTSNETPQDEICYRILGNYKKNDAKFLVEKINEIHTLKWSLLDSNFIDLYSDFSSCGKFNSIKLVPLSKADFQTIISQVSILRS